MLKQGWGQKTHASPDGSWLSNSSNSETDAAASCDVHSFFDEVGMAFCVDILTGSATLSRDGGTECFLLREDLRRPVGLDILTGSATVS